MKPKLINGVLHGNDLPAHIGKAYGRYIFRLFHGKAPKWSIWLRDMPMNIFDLDYNGHPEALLAYVAECDRLGIPAAERIGA